MRLRQLLKSKIHRATVTEANVHYVGSITIDSDLLERVDLWEGELVHVWNVDNGERFETYALVGQAGSGVICVNGAAAHKVQVGDRVIVTAFSLTDEAIVPKMILVDSRNCYVTDLSAVGE
jgi:L-aspartate-alpha-decarboxylase